MSRILTPEQARAVTAFNSLSASQRKIVALESELHGLRTRFGILLSMLGGRMAFSREIQEEFRKIAHMEVTVDGGVIAYVLTYPDKAPPVYHAIITAEDLTSTLSERMAARAKEK